MKKTLFFLCTGWVALFNNSRMSPESPTYDILCLFRVPRQVRFFEVVVVVLAYLTCIDLQKPRCVRSVNTLLALFLSVACIGLVASDAVDAERAQEIYIRVVPLVLFGILCTVGVGFHDLVKLSRFFVWLTLASIVTAIVVQIPRYGFHEDNIHGFFSDAHILGSIVAIIAVGFQSAFIETRRLRYLAATAALLMFSLYPGNEKVVLLSVVWCTVSLAKVYLLPRGWFSRMVLALLFVGGTLVAARHCASQEDSPIRLSAISELEPLDLGPIAAWPIAIDWLTTSPTTTLVGMGAGEYGWLTAFRAVSSGGGSAAAQTFSFEFALENTQAAGFLFRTNTWTSLLVEFGVIGFALFVAGVLVIVRAVLRAPALSGSERTMLRVFTFTFVVVVFQGLFTPFSNWSESILMFPLMYIAAYFVGRNDASRVA